MLVIPASIKNDGKASDRKSTYIVIRREGSFFALILYKSSLLPVTINNKLVGVGHLSLRHFTLEADDLIFRSR